MLNKIPINLQELLGALAMVVLYALVYLSIESDGRDGGDFLLLMGLFWLALIGMRVGR